MGASAQPCVLQMCAKTSPINTFEQDCLCKPGRWMVDRTCTGSLLQCPPFSAMYSCHQNYPWWCWLCCVLGCGHLRLGVWRNERMHAATTEWMYLAYRATHVKNVRRWRSVSCGTQEGMPYLLGLLAMIKCSICSYQCDNWYVSNWRLACHIYFCLGKRALELARRPSRVALAWHTAGSSIPFGVTSLGHVRATRLVRLAHFEKLMFCRLQLAGITAFTSWRTNLSPFTKGCREWDASMWLPQFLRSSWAPTIISLRKFCKRLLLCVKCCKGIIHIRPHMQLLTSVNLTTSSFQFWQVLFTVGSSSQANCLLRNSAMDDSIGGS